MRPYPTQCFYKLQPESSSVSLQVITSSAKDRFHPKEFWRKKFHPTKADEAEEACDDRILQPTEGVIETYRALVKVREDYDTLGFRKT